MNRKNKITSSEENRPAVLGSFEGECADSNITNLNGLDITREVWENVFNSDDYKKAIEHGWYIGFLGHPEDPNCMDFEHACIVMKDGRIDDNGKIFGSFDLIDTPVGRIVKTFIDSGVKFGISVRGAGDIIDNSVDPDTFIFRGFDLVAFPAYPESIPTFTEVAASADLDSQRRYKVICSTVKNNIEGLNTVESIDIIQSHFAKQSEEYKSLQKRKDEIKSSEFIESNESIDITEDKVNGLTDVYLNERAKVKKLEQVNASLNVQLSQALSDSNRLARKLKAFNRIVSDQNKNIEELENIYNKKFKVYSSRVERSKKSINSLNSAIEEKDRRIQTLERANSRITSSVNNLKSTIAEQTKKIENLESSNLKYNQKITSAQKLMNEKDTTISRLRQNLNETVSQNSKDAARTSNLDAQVRNLKSRLEACQRILSEYQDEYADLYANALGVTLNNVSVTASTSVADLKSMISNSASASSDISFDQPAQVDMLDYDDSGLVTL